MFEAAAILVSVCIFIFNYLVNKDIFYPPALFSLAWTIILLIYAIFLVANGAPDSYIIDGRCLAVFIGGELVFSAGGYLATNRALKEQTRPATPVIMYNFDRYVFLFLFLFLPLYIKASMDLANSSDLKDVNFFIALRYEYTAKGASIGILGYLNSVAVFGFAVALYKFHFTEYKKNWGVKIYKILFYLVVFTYAVLLTGRTVILLLICIYAGFRAVKGSLTKKTLFTTLLFFVLAFAIYAFVLHKGGSEYLSLGQNIQSIFSTLIEYTLGGVYAFNSFIKNGFFLDYGENSFRFLIAVLNSAGLIETAPKPLVMPFIYTPIESNVYSVYYVYIKDFWYFGILFLGLFGYLHTRFFYRAKRDFFNLYMYGLLLYPLVMSSFQDQYFNLLSTWLQLFALGCIALPFIEYKKDPEGALI